MEENKENQPQNNEQPAQQTAPVAEEKLEQLEQEEEVPKDESEAVEEKKPMSFPKFNFNIKNIPSKFINMLREFRRVIIVSRKPDLEEISTISKISCLGILIMGLLGFAIQIMFQLIVSGGV